jgi:hypothetical protein
MLSKYTIWHYAVSNLGGVHEIDASSLSLICSIVSSQWLRDAKFTLGHLMWAYFCTVLLIRLLFPQQAHCPLQTSVNSSSVMCRRNNVGLLGNYSLSYLCSKPSLSIFLCIMLPLFLRSMFHLFFLSSCNTSFIYSRITLFLIFFLFLTRFPLSCFFLSTFLHFPFLFSYSFLSSVFYPCIYFFFFYSCLTFFICQAVVFESCKYSRTPLIRINWDG